MGIENMGYVTRNLMNGEEVVHVGRLHWIIFVPGVFSIVLGIFFIGATDADAPAGEADWAPLIGAILFLYGIFSLIRAFILRISTELAVTTKRVIAKTGLISRQTIELNHSKVESLNVDQSITGRILNYGTVFVCGTGGGKTPVPKIKRPLQFRRAAMDLFDNQTQGAHAG